MPVNYLPTLQPLQGLGGGDLPSMLKGTANQPWHMSNMLTSQPPNSNDAFSKLNSAIMDGPAPNSSSSTFLPSASWLSGGFNWG